MPYNELGMLIMETDERAVIYDKRGHVAYVTLNRPHVLNAMNAAMHEELATVWDDVEADDNIWLCVLTGAAERAFSVGQDLTELTTRIRDGESGISSFGSQGKPGWPRLTERFDFCKPIIAKVRGYALGGGFELALACDLIIASESAQFGLPEAKLGLIPGAGGVFRLATQIPLKIAMGYLMTGRRISARQALALGLVNEVTLDSDLDLCVESWVDAVLDCAPLSVRSIKEAALKARSLSMEQAFMTHYEWETVRSHSEDSLEGPLAFNEKRRPVWKAR